LRPLSELFPSEVHPQILVGLTEPDDAAVCRIDEHRAIISTADFFPPVVDDPYDFGAIAAANALSDVYAMGGRPLMAINLVAWPDDLDKAILAEILRGGAEKVREAGAVIAGGHSISDAEPKYGLSVTGEIDPGQIMQKSGARPGDQLILSKALGTGLITTALKRGLAEQAQVDAAVQSMSRLSGEAAALAQRHQVSAMTDITGFGLIGHGLEMARLSRVDFELDFACIRFLPGAEQFARRGVFPGGMDRNLEYFAQWVDEASPLPAYARGLLYDPQTSGGLLMAVARDKADALLTALVSQGEAAYLLGRVVDGSGRIVVNAAAE